LLLLLLLLLRKFRGGHTIEWHYLIREHRRWGETHNTAWR
jgi:hypothetical protein